MDNLIKIKKFLMEQIESSTGIMSKCKLEDDYKTSYHFECERRAYLCVLDYVTDEIKRLEKGGK